jgi:hypothetical protein
MTAVSPGQIWLNFRNEALEGIPSERVRLHVCWGNGEWPHV